MQFRQISAQASRKRRLSVFLAAGAFALAGFGTQAQAQEAAQAEGDNDLGSWVKVCVEEPTLEDQEVCLVTQEARADTGEFIAAVTVGTLVEEDQKILRAMLPIGSILPPGFAVQIDEAEPQQATYTQCLPQACYGEMAIDSDYVDELKAGGNLILYWIDHEGSSAGWALP